jgi:hypothetical protein
MCDKYISKYSNGKEVSQAQFITEIICERKAQKDRLDLHYRFWVHNKWAAFFRNQIGSAHKLLKTYSAKAIIRALNTDQGKKIYSLRAPHLPAIIEQQEINIKQENTSLSLTIERKDNIAFGIKSPVSKNIISKLKDLDQ